MMCPESRQLGIEGSQAMAQTPDRPGPNLPSQGIPEVLELNLYRALSAAPTIERRFVHLGRMARLILPSHRPNV